MALTHDREIANLTKRIQDETDDGSQGQQGLFVFFFSYLTSYMTLLWYHKGSYLY